MCIIRKFVVWFDSSSFSPLLPGITLFLFLSEGLPLSSFPLFGCLEPPSLPHLLVFLDTDKSFHIPLCSPCHCPFRMLFLLNLSWSPRAPLLKGTVGPCLPWFPAPLSEFPQCPLVAASLCVRGCQQAEVKEGCLQHLLLPLHPISPLPSIL